MSLPKAGVIFDLDGVLIDSENLQYKAYQEVLAPYGISVTREEYAVHWIAAGRGPEYAVSHLGLPISPAELRATRSPVYHRILRAEIEAMPGAVEALARLGAVFPLVLATNSLRLDVDFVMDRFDMRRHFTDIVTRDDYGKAKPEPDAFLTAADRLGLPPEKCVVIEDAHKGVLAAHRAGIPVIAVPNDFTAENDFSLAAKQVPSLDAVTVEMIEAIVQ